MFMALELPLDSRSSTTSSNGTSSSSSSMLGAAAASQSMLNKPRTSANHFHRINYLNPTRPVPAPPVSSISSMSGSVGGGVGVSGGGSYGGLGGTGGAGTDGCYTGGVSPVSTTTSVHDLKPTDRDSLKSYHSNYNYGHITAQHEYTYIDSNTVQSLQPTSHHVGGILKKPALPPPSNRSPSTLPLPIKKKGTKSGRECRLQQCRHCLEEFNPSENRRGGCEYAPDPVLTGIERVSCISCAQCMLYHCWREEVGDEAGAPARPPGRRWAALAVLSVLVPCLWFYLPLKACHRLGASCALCGAKHEA